MTTADLDCGRCGARTAGLLCGLEGAVGARLRRARRVESHGRGTTILRQGAEVQTIHVIASGLVKASCLWEGGVDHVLAVLGPGGSLGWRSLLAGEPHDSNAEALERTTTCAFRAGEVREALDEAPALASALLVELARGLRRSEEIRFDMLHRRAPQRVARLLLESLDWGRGSVRSAAFRFHGLTHRGMATLAGVTPETFSRVLRGLAHRGVIDVRPDRVEILDPGALRLAAGMEGSPAPR